MPLIRDADRGWQLELLFIMFGVPGVGWLASGFYVQGILRMFGGWALFLVAVVFAVLLSRLLDFLPSPLPWLALAPGFAPPLALAFDLHQIYKRVEDAEPPPYRGQHC